MSPDSFNHFKRWSESVEENDASQRHYNRDFSHSFNLRDCLNRIRIINPKVISLPMTSINPFGIILKEAYHHAFPDEPQPKFLTIDVKAVRAFKNDFDTQEKLSREHHAQMSPLRRFFYCTLPKSLGIMSSTSIEEKEDFAHYYQKEVGKRMKRTASRVIRETTEKLRKYGLHEGDKVLVIDDSGGIPPKELTASVISRLYGNEYSHKGTLGIVCQVLEEATSNISSGIKVSYEAIPSAHTRNLGPWVGMSIRESYKGYKKEKLIPTRRYYGKEERDIVRENMNILKGLGRDIGDKIAQERKKAKDLEHCLSAILGIIGIGIGLFFLNSDITGNVIYPSNQSPNLLGLFVFIISTILFLFSLKRIFRH